MWSTRGTSHCPGWTTTLTAPRSSSERRSLNPMRVELLPGDAGLERRRLLADAAVARDELERQLAQVAGLDGAHRGW